MDSLKSADPSRLDQKVVEILPRLSRAFASKLIEQGKVKINGQVTTKAGQKVHPSDKINIDYDLKILDNLPVVKLPIIYEDDDCVVINKPVGLLTHSKGAFNPEATVASWLSGRYIDPINERSGIVHRLDRATSGVMIGAKSLKATAWLQKQFSKRKVKKTYLAIVDHTPDPPEAIIDMPIERNPKAPATFRVGINGKSAITHYKVLKIAKNYTLLELYPQTGRTHQLRVHLAKLGFPIVGDTFYGGQPADRLYLHAHKLELTLPNHSRQVFTAVMPASFKTKMSS